MNDLLFSESDYLRANPDVADACSSGSVRRGLDHLIEFGVGECRGGVSGKLLALYSKLGQRRLIPPLELVERVHGGRDPSQFLRTGNRISIEIHQALAREGIFPQTIYEFGCGCGRVLHPLSFLFSGSEILGSDIDREALSWLAKSSVEARRWELFINSDLPPLQLPDASVDFCYAISVFTHLPVDMQDAWMGELARILKAGGVLLISTQPTELITPHLVQNEINQMLSEGVFYKKFQNTEGLPEYYQACWHTKRFLQNRWQRWFDLIDFMSKGIAGHHDLSLFRKVPERLF